MWVKSIMQVREIQRDTITISPEVQRKISIEFSNDILHSVTMQQIWCSHLQIEFINRMQYTSTNQQRNMLSM